MALAGAKIAITPDDVEIVSLALGDPEGVAGFERVRLVPDLRRGPA